MRIIASPNSGATDKYLIPDGTSNVGLIVLVQTISSKTELLIFSIAFPEYTPWEQ
jgi:hypothetical protein